VTFRQGANGGPEIVVVVQDEVGPTTYVFTAMEPGLRATLTP